MKTSDRYMQELERRLKIMEFAIKGLKERGLIEKEYCFEKARSLNRQLELTIKQLEHEKKGIAL